MSNKNKLNGVVRSAEDLVPIKETFREIIQTDPKYSLEPDPTGELRLTDGEKRFVSSMIRYGFTNFKELKDTLEEVSYELDITIEEAKDMWYKNSIKNEIDRIGYALSMRQYNNKSFSLEEIKGYATSLVTGYNVPVNERLSASDKLKALNLISQITEFEMNLDRDPKRMGAIDVETTSLDNLSLDEVKALVSGIDENKSDEILNEKNSIINQIKIMNPHISPSQVAFLRNLPLDALKKKMENLKEFNDEKTKYILEETPTRPISEEGQKSMKMILEKISKSKKDDKNDDKN